MKSKKSRVGRTFQAVIPDLFTKKERDEDRKMLFGNHSTQTESVQSLQENTAKPVEGSMRLYLLRGTKQSDRNPKLLWEQHIPHANLLNRNITLSEEQYKRIVTQPRARYQAVLEAQRRKFHTRRTSRRRGMRCHNYKEWDERGFADEQSVESSPVYSSHPKVKVPVPVPKELQQDKKRTRSNDVNPGKSKKRRLSDQNMHDVIDLVDLSDSPEATLCHIEKPQNLITISSPRRHKYKTLSLSPHSTFLGDDGELGFGEGNVNGDSLEKNGESTAVPPNVLSNLGANTLPSQNRQAFQPSQSIIGRLSGFRPSSSNSKAMIPVIEL